MTKEQALEKRLEQTKWQFPNHVVFIHKGKVYHFDPSNFDENNIFTQTGLKVYKEEDDNVALYDPKYFKVGVFAVLEYKGIAAENIPQPINLKRYNWIFNTCRCETINLSDWDFSEVVTMRYMFCNKSTKTVILGNVDLSKCKDFDSCFNCCSELEELTLGDYKVSQDANVVDMFYGCHKLLGRYYKTEEELADIFKSGQWNSLQPVEAMEVF